MGMGMAQQPSAAPPGPPATVTPLTAGMRRLLIVSGGLVLVTAVQLFVFSEQTDVLFAWTIQPPLTAASLGAAYAASCVLEWLAARERTWARARVAVPAVLMFTTLTLAATLFHLDRFHLDSPAPVTRAAAWAWLVIYASVPPVMAVLLARQLWASGVDPPQSARLAPAVRGLLAFQAVVMLGLGSALFVAPQFVAAVWPWALTPLTARATGAWLVGLGVAAVHVVVEDDPWRVRPAMAGFAALGALQLVALARYPGSVNWAGPSGWVYVGFLLTLLGIGLVGWWSPSRGVDYGAPAR
jgi:hypothetical protein